MFPDLGSKPVHLGIAFACSTYAAFVPVPNITAATTSLSKYLPPANVPTVSLTYKISILKYLTILHYVNIKKSEIN